MSESHQEVKRGPKRPLSAYNFFAKVKGDMIRKEKQSQANDGRVLDSKAVNKLISEAWNRLTEKERQPYNSMHEQDKLRFIHEGGHVKCAPAGYNVDGTKIETGIKPNEPIFKCQEEPIIGLDNIERGGSFLSLLKSISGGSSSKTDTNTRGAEGYYNGTSELDEECTGPKYAVNLSEHDELSSKPTSFFGADSLHTLKIISPASEYDRLLLEQAWQGSMNFLRLISDQTLLATTSSAETLKNVECETKSQVAFDEPIGPQSIKTVEETTVNGYESDIPVDANLVSEYVSDLGLSDVRAVIYYSVPKSLDSGEPQSGVSNRAANSSEMGADRKLQLCCDHTTDELYFTSTLESPAEISVRSIDLDKYTTAPVMNFFDAKIGDHSNLEENQTACNSFTGAIEPSPNEVNLGLQPHSDFLQVQVINEGIYCSDTAGKGINEWVHHDRGYKRSYQDIMSSNSTREDQLFFRVREEIEKDHDYSEVNEIKLCPEFALNCPERLDGEGFEKPATDLNLADSPPIFLHEHLYQTSRSGTVLLNSPNAWFPLLSSPISPIAAILGPDSGIAPRVGPELDESETGGGLIFPESFAQQGNKDASSKRVKMDNHAETKEKVHFGSSLAVAGLGTCANNTCNDGYSASVSHSELNQLSFEGVAADVASSMHPICTPKKHRGRPRGRPRGRGSIILNSHSIPKSSGIATVGPLGDDDLDISLLSHPLFDSVDFQPEAEARF